MNVRTKRKILGAAMILVLAVIGCAAYYFISLYNGLQGLSKSPEDSPLREFVSTENDVAAPPEWTGAEPVHILVMGMDARGQNEIARSDSMLVVSLDPAKKRIHLFSILRDTYTDIPGHGKNRINTAITHGPHTAMKAVGDLLGIPIQYYVYTDFQGFIELVDAIGGVDFYVEKDMNYADGPQYSIDLKKGEQHLDGKKALQYVRFRNDATSDYTRTERQREFLKAVTDKLKTTTAIMKFPSILADISPYIDTNMSVDDMWRLVSLGYQSTMGESVQIPQMKLLNETYVGRAAVLTITSESELQEDIKDIFNESEAIPDNSDVLQNEPQSTYRSHHQ